jgi:opacity protein-like surface antigen
MLKQVTLAGALMFPAIAVAQPIQGLYIGGNAGVSFAGSLLSSQPNRKIYTDDGPLGLAAVGWGFGNGLRTEIEGSYRSNGIDVISVRRINGMLEPLTNVSGNAATYAVMANVAYDIPLHLPVQPYIGAGLGYGWLNLGNAHGNAPGIFRLPNNNTIVGPETVSFGTAGAFAYQAVVGASLPVRAFPGLAFTLEYRFFGMAGANVPITRATTTGDLVNGAHPSSTSRNGFNVLDNAVLIGVRYQFRGS